MTQIEIFTTSDLCLATTLSLSFPIDCIDRQDPGRVVFTFVWSAQLALAVEQFWKGELRIEPQQFFSQLRVVKARIYDQPRSAA